MSEQTVTELSEFEIKDDTLQRYTGGNTHIIIPEGVKKIRSGAFRRSRLVSAHLPDSLAVIGEDAFLDCSSLERINLPAGLKEIGFQAFRGCAKLQDVTIPDSVTFIGSYAFMDCAMITEIIVPGTDIYISEDAFRNSGIRKFTILEGKIGVPDRCCYGCLKLEEVDLAKSVTKIGRGAFASCRNLKKINLHEGITEIGESAFYMCSCLGNVALPSSVRKIGNLAFMGCGMTEVTVPDGMTSLSKCPFGTGLKKINLPDGVTKIDLDTFTGCTRLEEINFSKADEFMYCFLGTPFSAKHSEV